MNTMGRDTGDILLYESPHTRPRLVWRSYNRQLRLKTQPQRKVHMRYVSYGGFRALVDA
jgi:hypothetical protein